MTWWQIFAIAVGAYLVGWFIAAVIRAALGAIGRSDWLFRASLRSDIRAIARAQRRRAANDQ